MPDEAEVKALAEAATPGPWYVVEHRFEDYTGVCTKNRDRITGNGRGYPYDPGCSRADAEFIAAAREAVPALIDEVERLQEENERNANR